MALGAVMVVVELVRPSFKIKKRLKMIRGFKASGKNFLFAMAAVAAGADGLIIEVHNDPPHALSDGAQSLTPKQFDGVAKKVFGLKKAVDKLN